LISKGFDQMYGARPLKRTIQRYVEDPLAEELIAKKIRPNEVVRILVKDDDHLIFEQGTKIKT
jgi:ATP-dependent Clp protease ATP-binding subunit ClpA